MERTAVLTTPRQQGPPIAIRSGWCVTWQTFQKDKAAVAAAALLLLIFAMTLAAPWLSPYDPIDGNTSLRLAPIGTPGHLLGMDGQGRDIFSRILWGGRVTLPSAIVPVLVATIIGVTLGVIAGFHGGLIGHGIMRGCDVLFAFPTVILAIAIAGIIGRGLFNVMLALSVVLVPPMTRVTFTATREIEAMEYIQAARSIGAQEWIIMLRHILPNIIPSVIVYASTVVGLLVVFSAGLSFLGLGVAPPIADWGVMVSDGRMVLGVAPHVATVPGLMISVTSLCCNLVGDGLRYALDPRMRHIG
jgi:ABC-type dipeptide/oligopeptide/nickel transport system permease subunit